MCLKANEIYTLKVKDFQSVFLNRHTLLIFTTTLNKSLDFDPICKMSTKSVEKKKDKMDDKIINGGGNLLFI